MPDSVDKQWPANPFGKGPQSLSGTREAFLTYEPYYGLTEKPFSISPDPRFLYKSRSHAATLDDLLLGIQRREGLIVLTGDIGTGKTTLCRAALDRLDRKTFSTFVPDPFLSREDLLKMLLVDFGVVSIDDLKGGRLSGATRPDLSYPLYEFLKSLLPLQAFAVLVIDEAQNLSLPLLEEIRILSDLEAPEKLLQVVLVGQLEFRAKLKLPEMRQLDHRVSVRCNLEPLQRDGVAGYIAHRLKVAGGGPDRVEFSPDAVNVVSKASAGVPRLINLICDRALYRGYLTRSARIEADAVALAITDLGVGDLTPTPPAIGTPSQQARGMKALASGHDAPRADDADLDVNGLHEDPHVGVHEPIRTATDAAPEAAASDTDGTFAPQNSRKVALRLGESMSTSRWRRRTHRFGKILMAVMAVALVAVLAESALMYFYPELTDETQQAPTPAEPARLLPRGPVPPAVPSNDLQAPPLAAAVATGEKGYAIDVALFAGADRSSQLVERLVAAGFAAYQVEMDLGSRGLSYVVLVGNYQTPEDAQPDLARLCELPGYADARIIAAPSKTASQ
jgi:type II secretory pathway predicted ATPase ExeA/cell division septation protein DedD